MSSSASPAHSEQLLARADLELRFAATANNKTYIDHQFSRYPFHICKAQYVDDTPTGLATVYLQSSSGGIFENDNLCAVFETMQRAQSHITTQASTIVHSMYGGTAQHHVNLETGENSYLEYMPEPVILFPGSALDSRINICQHADSIIIVSDGFIQHDPQHHGDTFNRYASEIKVTSPGGQLLCLDRYSVSGEMFGNGALGVMGDCVIQCTMLVLTGSMNPAPLSESLRSVINGNTEVYAGVSLLPNSCGLVIRVIAKESFHAKRCMTKFWEQVRLQVFNRLPAVRRK